VDIHQPYIRLLLLISRLLLWVYEWNSSICHPGNFTENVSRFNSHTIVVAPDSYVSILRIEFKYHLPIFILAGLQPEIIARCSKEKSIDVLA
jgi:hypothetical protein